MATEALSESSDPELEATAWDLEPLVEGEGKEGVERRLEQALERSRTFAERYAGGLGELGAEGLREVPIARSIPSSRVRS